MAIIAFSAEAVLCSWTEADIGFAVDGLMLTTTAGPSLFDVVAGCEAETGVVFWLCVLTGSAAVDATDCTDMSFTHSSSMP